MAAGAVLLVSNFFADYKVALNHAIREARKFNQEVQLKAGKEYTQKGFHVRLAVQDPAKRFGYDAQGEFIQPTDPFTVTHIAQAGFGYDYSGQNFSRLTEDTPVVVVETEHATVGNVIAYRVSDGLRMHIQKKALKLLTA